MAVNYDAQKAHEYYEKRKQLKGRHSTKGFSKSQKEQWAYAQDQLKQEHKAIGQSITAESKSIREQLSAAASQQIESLRTQLKAMSPEQRKAAKERIQGLIGTIRERLGLAKQELTTETKQAREQEKTANEQRIDEAYEHIKGNK